MKDLEVYERRAREAEELAELVSQPQNRRRYLAMATAWRELLERRKAPAQGARSA